MSALLSIRDHLQGFYYRFDFILKPLQKFLLAFVTLFLLQRYIGYMELLSRPVVLLGASALCAVLPYGGLTFVMACFCLADVYKASLMMAVPVFLIMLFIAVLYFGFKPGHGIVIAVTVLAFMLNIPYLVPLILGLTVGIISAAPAAIGVLFWFIIRYIHDYASEYPAGIPETEDIAAEFLRMTKDIFENKYMYIVILAFVLTIAVVSIISRLSINHCWTIGVVAGTAVLAAVMVLIGSFEKQTSFMADIISLCVSFLIALGFELVFYAADFRSVERVEFEDDDYYYYVRAVPKLKSDEDRDSYVL